MKIKLYKLSIEYIKNISNKYTTHNTHHFLITWLYFAIISYDYDIWVAETL